MSFFQSSQPIVIPEPNTGGVQTITAGSNVSLTGTAINPIVNAVSPIAALTAGSNVTLSGTSNITINATSGGGPSSSNISHHGIKEILTPGELAIGSSTSLFTIDPTYFSNANSSYLLTVDWYIPTATCSNVSGNVGVYVNYDLLSVTTQSFTLINQSTWGNTSNLNFSANMASTFIPNDGVNPLTFTIRNNTNGAITPASVELVVSITGLTTSNISANNWPPP